MKILLLGKNGQLGQVLNQTLSQLGKVIATTREQINLENLQDIPNQLKSIQPDIIINAAAYTNVDQAEIEQEKASIINAKAPAILAQYCKQQNIPLIHYSTDYVFDGKKQEPYTETDMPNPLNFYGKSKLLGEQDIQEQQGTYLIFRTSWVYSHEGNNFPNTILKLALQILGVSGSVITSPFSFIASLTSIINNKSKAQTKMYYGAQRSKNLDKYGAAEKN